MTRIRTESTNLMIGTTLFGGTPGSILFIDGSGNIGEDNTNLFWNNTTKRLGIGTNSPNNHLTVNGNINISAGMAYKYNNIIIMRAVTDDDNYFFGNSGNLTMTGFGNTSFGANSLFQNSSGSFNVAFGHNALFTQSTGNWNLAFGSDALYPLISGSSNIGIGNGVGYSSTEADRWSEIDDYMIFIGDHASRNENVTKETQLTNGIAIGKNARVGASNSLILGGTGADSISVGIRTATPSYPFHLDGLNTITASVPTIRLAEGIINFYKTPRPTTACTATDSGIAGNLNDTNYRYRITYVTTTGETSSDSTKASNAVTVVNKKIQLTDIPVSPSPSVTARNIYRTSGAYSGYYYKIDTIPNNIDTTYLDNNANLGYPAWTLLLLIDLNTAGGQVSGMSLMNVGSNYFTDVGRVTIQGGNGNYNLAPFTIKSDSAINDYSFLLNPNYGSIQIQKSSGNSVLSIGTSTNDNTQLLFLGSGNRGIIQGTAGYDLCFTTNDTYGTGGFYFNSAPSNNYKLGLGYSNGATLPSRLSILTPALETFITAKSANFQGGRFSIENSNTAFARFGCIGDNLVLESGLGAGTNGTITMLWNTGDVGIGTSAPAISVAGKVVQINAASNGASVVHFTNGTTGALASDGLVAGIWNDGNCYWFNYEASDLGFYTNGEFGLYLTSTHKAAIGGSTTPTAKLYVSGVIDNGASSDAYGLYASTTIQQANLHNAYASYFGGVVNSGQYGTATNAYAGYFAAMTNTGAPGVTNAYGVRIATPTIGATKNYGLYVDGGLSYFGGNVGIGTTSPTNILSLTGQAAEKIWMERHTTSNTAGNDLTVQAGGATTGATNKAGGSLNLLAGTSTGNGSPADVNIGTTAVGASGTSDQVLVNKFMIHNKVYSAPDDTYFDVFSVNLPTAGSGATVHLSFTYNVSDATHGGTHSGIYVCAFANDNGTVVGTCTDSGEAIAGSGAGGVASDSQQIISVSGTTVKLQVKFNNTISATGSFTCQVLNNSATTFAWL